ncbi:Cytosolic seryl-tRNA synthetase [Coemansia sp. RSA 921]|nr:Cytosolic seryl-tRNA synthetase [Coemansia sp. RSA 921]
MLDINLFQTEKGGNPELIRESQRRRGANPGVVDEIIDLYKSWTGVRYALDQLNREINKIQKEIGMKAKAKEDASELKAQKKVLDDKKKQLGEDEKEAEAAMLAKVGTVGNIVHDSVPVSATEDDNQIVRTHFVGGVEPKHQPELRSHHEVLYLLGGFDAKRGADVAGHRGYFLTGVGVDLNLAMINYGLQFLGARGYTKIQTPFFMRRDVMAKTAQLSQFDEELYKVSGGGEDKYLIATSEQPISAFHMNEMFEKPSEQLPIKYAGYSTCFRKEAGAHGKDTQGLFRVHQFEKIEQFVLTEPEKSWEMFDDMIGASEEFFQSLGVSYRVVSIVSSALNDAAAKKYDLEAWFPSRGEYKELVSCSNCTDFQSRNLEIRCGTKKMGDREKKYRALCCLLENYQTPEGLNIPAPLVPYMGGRDFVPFVKDSIPKNMK